MTICPAVIITSKGAVHTFEVSKSGPCRQAACQQAVSSAACLRMAVEATCVHLAKRHRLQALGPMDAGLVEGCLLACSASCAAPCI